jgi:hypothetical protein
MAAYKRIKDFAAKQYEFMPKVLTPAIFDKALLLPPFFTSRPGEQNALRPTGSQNAGPGQQRSGAKSRAG